MSIKRLTPADCLTDSDIVGMLIVQHSAPPQNDIVTVP